MALGLMLLGSCPAAAQASVEYGHVATGSSTAGSAGLGKLSNKLGAVLSPDNKSSSVQTVAKQPQAATAPEGNPADTNRLALEHQAGKEAAKLTLKSEPAKATVRINGKPVGQTPLLISLAPGVYKIEMEGPRMEVGKQQLNLGPNETREIELPLSAAPRYPSHIELQ
ncbi:MAG: PEGA domain-containing protein [Candidatus Korobacteraceae bacterium]